MKRSRLKSDPKKLREWQERSRRDNPLGRSTPLARGKGPRKRNPKRKKAEWERAYGSVERVLWMNGEPSVVSGKTPCVNAHVRTGGTGRKADACWIVPLTYAEHEELHAEGQETFEARHDVDLQAEARRTEKRWQKHASS